MPLRKKKDRNLITVAGFSTCSMAKQCTNATINMTLYLGKDLKFAVDLGWEELQPVNYFEVVEGR